MEKITDTKKRDALEALVRITNENLGYEPTTPSEFNDLILRIKKATGESLSLSSIKRIWGYVKHTGDFSHTTLNILARYNGMKDWESFKKRIDTEVPLTNDDDSGFHSDSMVDTGRYKPGDRIALRWNVGKGCVVECVDYMRFKVTKSMNIKLKEGDIVTLHTLCIGHPVYVSNIQRGDMHFTSYIGAKKGGLLSIRELADAD